MKEFQALEAVEAEVKSRGQVLHYRVIGDMTLHQKIVMALEEVGHEIHEELENGYANGHGHGGHG